MNAATIIALATAIPAILGAITAFIVALRGNGTAQTALATTIAHATSMASHPSAEMVQESAYQAQQAIGLARSTNQTVQQYVEKATGNPPTS